MFNGTLRELYRSGKMSNSSIYHDALYQTITACELLKNMDGNITIFITKRQS